MSPEWPHRRVIRASRALLRLGSRFVPCYRRRNWLDEWEGELWALEREGAGRVTLVRFGLAGIVEAIWERVREERMSGLTQDVRHAFRRLVRAPVFTVVVVLVLALGIGMNASLFGPLNAALLARPPYPAADRLVSMDLLYALRADAPMDTSPYWSYPKYVMAEEWLTSLESLAAYSVRTANLSAEGRATRIGVEFVTPSYFELLGVRAMVGRVFGAADAYPAPGATVVLSHAFWTTHFGADASVIGRTLRLDGVTLEIVGVAPARFRGLTGGADVFVPTAAVAAISGRYRLTDAGAHWLHTIGRRKAGVTLEQARAQAATLGTALTTIYPDASPGGARQGVALVPSLRARVNPITRIAVSVASAAALVLLLIACANVAGLLVARSLARRTDVAVRAALGAGRGRLTREFLIEGLILAAVAGGLGVLFAFVGSRVVAEAVRYALDTTGTHGIQFLDPDSLGADSRVLASGLGLALLAGVLFGWLPARIATRGSLSIELRGGRAAFGDERVRSGNVGRAVLVAGQLALTLVLLAGAGLMAASFARLSSIDVGFRNDNVLSLRYEREPERGERRVFEEQLLERVGGLPGVTRVAIAPCPPLSEPCEIFGIQRVDDRPQPDVTEGILAYGVSDEYFTALGITLHAGRDFAATDHADTPPVAIVNEAAARKFFAGDAIGHRIAITHEITSEESGAMAEIIGVVSDVRYGSLEKPAIPAIYFSWRQFRLPQGTLFVQTAGDPLALTSAVRREAAELDPEMPLYDVTTLADLRRAAMARTRIVLGLLTAFAFAGLLLSAIGLFGLVTYTVAQRRREMGLRIALGAAAGDVVRLVVASPLRLAVVGATLGLAGSVLVTRFAATLLYETEPADLRVLAAATFVLIAVAVLAAWLPARRATRVDPAIALRGE